MKAASRRAGPPAGPLGSAGLPASVTRSVSALIKAVIADGVLSRVRPLRPLHYRALIWKEFYARNRSASVCTLIH
jgi:hypothetical protein